MIQLLSLLINILATILFPIYCVKGSIIAFYNIYSEGRHYKSIVREQLDVLYKSNLYNKLDKLNYITIGNDSSSFTINSIASTLSGTYVMNRTEKIVKIGSYRKGYETLMLRKIYDFCMYERTKTNVNSKILYFHNKGSLNYHEKIHKLRRALDCFNLNSHCISALDEFDTCGWRISPVPHIHHPGNMWWSKCSHIVKLVDPFSFEKNSTFRNKSIELLTKAESEDLDKGNFD